MGPTNQALLRLFHADGELRRAQDDLDKATRGVRVQKKRAELALQALTETHNRVQQLKAKNMEVEGDLKYRHEHIEHLRLQQQEATNNRQYQALLTQINAQKAEKDRIEEEGVARTGEIEDLQKQEAEQREAAKQEDEKAKKAEADIEGRTKELQAVIDDLQPKRDAAAAEVSDGLVSSYERLADNYDGEAMAPIGHIEGKEERYYCTACNMELVVDVYNRLKTRDDVVTCPGCGRMLYIPEELTPEMAVRQKKKPAKRVTRKKATTKAPAKKDRKGVPADVKRVLTTAAAESMRQAQTDEQATTECEIRVKGVDEAVGPFTTGPRDQFAKLVAGKMQAADLELEYEVVDLHSGEADSGDSDVTGDATITPADTSADGASGSPTDGDPSDRVPSQPTVSADTDETTPVA